MKRNQIIGFSFAILSLVFMLGLMGCKAKDEKKAEACLKSAAANMEACQGCCKDAGYSGYSWTSEICRCL